ncbi:hypothetical protein AMTRI_Chr02g215150 [Amborella trichopoda]
MLMACFEKKDGSLSNLKFDQERSRSDLVKMVVLHEYPFSIMVSPNTIKSDMLEMYGNEKDKLHSLLQKIPSCICLTTNIWTSCPNQGYLCLTGHFIDDA